jgi:drug/metabolite transporter (DMT)-like permease
VIFLDEKIDLLFGLAAALIFAGVFLVTRKYVPSET